MKRYIISIFIFFQITSCSDSKWELKSGKGIDDNTTTINDNVIYFDDENNGIIGGQTSIHVNRRPTLKDTEDVPILFITSDAGSHWKEIRFDSTINKPIKQVYLHLDTLTCQTDSLYLFSSNKGSSFITYKGINEYKFITKKYFNIENTTYDGGNIEYKGITYTVEERLRNNLVTVIKCYGHETLTNYYFVSNDHENSWTLISKEFGSNIKLFLIADKYLYRYHYPLGLERMPLK